MKKQISMFKTFLSIIIIVSIFAFNKCSTPTDDDIHYCFEMFYLSDSNITYSEMGNMQIEKIILQEKPFINANDIQTFIVFYEENNEISFYNFILNDSLDKRLADHVRPFVLIVNESRYIAEYWPTLTAFVPKSILLYKTFGLQFEFFIQNPNLDDDRIIKTLNELGVEIEYKNIGGS